MEVRSNVIVSSTLVPTLQPSSTPTPIQRQKQFISGGTHLRERDHASSLTSWQQIGYARNIISAGILVLNQSKYGISLDLADRLERINQALERIIGIRSAAADSIRSSDLIIRIIRGWPWTPSKVTLWMVWIELDDLAAETTALRSHYLRFVTDNVMNKGRALHLPSDSRQS